MHRNPNKSEEIGDDIPQLALQVEAEKIKRINDIPLELQEDIIKRTDDLKTLLLCTSVSKAWNSLIKSPQFIADYHIRRQRHHLLIHKEFNDDFVRIVDDDDTFPQNKVSLPLPDPVKPPYTIQGSSLGLFYFILHDYSRYDFGTDDEDANDDIVKPMAVVWNPSIRKSITVSGRVCSASYSECFVFGVSPHTNDPMLVKITYSSLLDIWHEPWTDDEEGGNITLDCITTSLPVEVYTLSSRVWTTLPISLPRNTIRFTPGDQVVIDEFIYWIAYDRILVDNCFFRNDHRLILSFDMNTRELTEICLPKELARPCGPDFCRLSKLRESLVVVERDSAHSYVIWKMECGVPNSFAKLYAIKLPNSYNQVRFRMSGGHIVSTKIFSHKDRDLFVYKPDSEHTYEIWMHGGLFNYIDTYMETLLLLNL